MNRIKNYQELKEERRKLETQLVTQKEYIRNEVDSVKQALEPIFKTAGFLKDLTSNPGSLVTAASSSAIALLVTKRFTGASWLKKLILTPLLRLAGTRTLEKVRQKLRGIKAE